jgi:hypothetical protein
MKDFKLSINAMVKLAALQDKTCGYKDMMCLEFDFRGFDLREVLDNLFALKPRLRKLWFENNEPTAAVAQTRVIMDAGDGLWMSVTDLTSLDDEDENEEWDGVPQNFPYRCIWESPAGSAIDIMINDLLENYGTERE